MQVASIIPSSKILVKKVASKFDFSQPRIIVEYGPGEGCHTREIARQMSPESKLILFELDPELAEHLKEQFQDDPRIIVLNANALDIQPELAKLGIESCDYVVSGIPFSILEINKKRELLRHTFDALKPNQQSAFIIYQVTNELRGHATVFPRAESEYCLQNIPPMFVTVFYKQALNGNHAPELQTANGNGTH